MTRRLLSGMSARLRMLLIVSGVLLLAWLLWGLNAQREIRHAADGSVMKVIPASDFLMGSEESHPDASPDRPSRGPLTPERILFARAQEGWRHADEGPLRRVQLHRYAIDRYEVTNGQYRVFLEEIGATGDHTRCHPDEPKVKDHTPRYWSEFNPLLRDTSYARTTPFGFDTFRTEGKPVVGVDWFDAYAYAAWAGKRLPTEAEWERAARGRDGRRWPWGNQWAWGKANVGGEKKGQDVPAKGVEKDGFIYAAPVGSFPEGRSPAGCDDMAGNVAEWCADWYGADAYERLPAQSPQGPMAGVHRVVRGGGSSNLPSAVRCTRREHHEPEFRTFTLGFRCARDM